MEISSRTTLSLSAKEINPKFLPDVLIWYEIAFCCCPYEYVLLDGGGGGRGVHPSLVYL
jgi:hypothetical protein